MELTKKNLEEMINNLPVGTDKLAFEFIGGILQMDDEAFSLLAPYIIEEYRKEMSLPQNRNAYIKEINAIDDPSTIVEYYNTIITGINELPLSELKKDFLKIIFQTASDIIKEENSNKNDVITIPIELCNKDAKIPEYANLGDAGMDVYALEDITINPGETKLIKTGIKVAVPKGYELQVRPKSGRSLKSKLRVANTPGTIDSGYRDEVGIIIENIEPPILDIDYHFEGKTVVIDNILQGKNYTIGKGEKIAQLVLSKTCDANFLQINDITTIGGDRGGGFGSTGLK